MTNETQRIKNQRGRAYSIFCDRIFYLISTPGTDLAGRSKKQ
jgi:hypothetical protein